MWLSGSLLSYVCIFTQWRLVYKPGIMHFPWASICFVNVAFLNCCPTSSSVPMAANLPSLKLIFRRWTRNGSFRCTCWAQLRFTKKTPKFLWSGEYLSTTTLKPGFPSFCCKMDNSRCFSPHKTRSPWLTTWTIYNAKTTSLSCKCSLF